MSQRADAGTDDRSFKLATFQVGTVSFGVDILKVQEINKLTEMTRVPQAPGYVLGVMNLRGRIVTVIDLGRKLNLPPTQLSDESRNVIVNSKNEHIGFLVDRIADVVPANWDDVSSAPSNVGGAQGKFFKGVLKTEGGLIVILDADEVLRIDEH
jgi:purine-binding chemotaxis protein CheW